MKYAIVVGLAFVLGPHAAWANSCEDGIRARITLINCPKIRSNALHRCQDAYAKKGGEAMHGLDSCPKIKENATQQCVDSYIKRDCGAGTKAGHGKGHPRRHHHVKHRKAGQGKGLDLLATKAGQGKGHPRRHHHVKHRKAGQGKG